MVKSAHLAFSAPKLEVEVGTKICETVAYLIMSWPFGVNGFRHYCLASWIVTGDSGLRSYKSDIVIVGMLPRLVTADNDFLGC